MKIVHVSSSSTGGAGIAALRLHIGLMVEGIESSFLILNGTADSTKNIFKYDIHVAFFRKVLNYLGLPKSFNQIGYNLPAGTNNNYEIFSLPFSNYDLTLHPLIREADVINLHWVSGFIDYPSFFNKIKKPIVWTLHDMNPFQGGFHYAEDMKRNKHLYGRIDDRIINLKKKSLSKFKDLIVVTPSKWLKTCSEKSEILGKYQHYHIPNGLNTEVFKPNNIQYARKLFNLPLNKTILLFVSESITNPRKGFDLILEALQKTKITNACLVAVGHSQNSIIEKNIIYINKINDERLMPLLYSAANAFILPSREDNLPNVMLESLCCGTPVIASPAGGMKEVIKEGFNGLLAEELSPSSLSNAINKFLQNPNIFNEQEIKEDAISKYKLLVQAQGYIRLYQSVVNGSS